MFGFGKGERVATMSSIISGVATTQQTMIEFRDTITSHSERVKFFNDSLEAHNVDYTETLTTMNRVWTLMKKDFKETKAKCVELANRVAELEEIDAIDRPSVGSVGEIGSSNDRYWLLYKSMKEQIETIKAEVCTLREELSKSKGDSTPIKDTLLDEAIYPRYKTLRRKSNHSDVCNYLSVFDTRQRTKLYKLLKADCDNEEVGAPDIDHSGRSLVDADTQRRYIEIRDVGISHTKVCEHLSIDSTTRQIFLFDLYHNSEENLT